MSEKFPSNKMMKSFKIQDMSPSQLFSLKYLDKNANSNQFLKAIAYDVDMTKLLKVIKTCYYHQSMEYCPVLISIENSQLKEYFRGNYLMQVFNSSGICVFQKVLNYEIISWNIFFNYFVFKLHENEAESDYFYILKFKEDGTNHLIKVKDIFNDKSYRYIGLSQKNLFLANDTEIKIIGFKQGVKEQTTKVVVPKPGQFATYNLEGKNKLHGFFENKESINNNFLLMIVENSQNVIDFAKMTFTGGESQVENIQIHQYREVVGNPKNLGGDSIRYIRQYISSNEMAVTCAFRNSGHVDFYYDYELVDSSEECYDLMDMNSKYIYLKKMNGEQLNEDNEKTETSVEIDMATAQRIGESVGVEKQLDPLKWYFNTYDLVRNHARIFNSITLVNTNFFVAFNNIVAIYNVVEREFKNFFYFEDQVVGLLRNQISKNLHELNVGALLQNGDIQLIEKADSSISSDDWQMNSSIKIKVDGKILRVVSDWRDISSHYILSQLSTGQKRLSGFQRNVITVLDQVVAMRDGDELIRCITKNEQEDFLLLNRKEKLIRTFSNIAQRNSDQMVVKQERKIKILEYPDKNDDSASIIDLLGKNEFHAAVGNKENNYLLLFSRYDVIKLKIEIQEQTQKQKKAGGVSYYVKDIVPLLDSNILGLQVIDQEYCYSLGNESKQGRAGFYIQNINGLIDAKENSSNFRLKAALAGQNDLLDYYKDDQRIAYISSYDVIRIVPLLHRTVLGFIGMRPRSDYLAFRKFGDRLYALDRWGYITIWDVMTGKVLEQKSRDVFQNFTAPLKRFEPYRNGPDDLTYLSEWYSTTVLLINKKDPQDVDEKIFYGDRLTSELGANTSFMATIQKQFYRYRLIEIKDTKDVYEHFNFVHPYYGDDKFHRLFFCKDQKLMLERHEQNVILYSRKDSIQKTLGSNDSQEVTWEIVSRIKRFPHELASCTFVNYLFSPNLLYYLDYSKAKKIFVIKKSMDQTDLCVIPKALMSPGENQDAQLAAKKFKWISDEIIRVVSNDGIEKTVDITKGCKQTQYGTVPMLDLQYLKKEKYSHYFYDMSITQEQQTLERLKRKYQEFFSGYFSNGLRDPQDLYNILFKIDYNIDKCKGKVVADLSFSYFHWKIAELMKDLKKFNIKRYPPEEIKILALNIFPRGNTVLHYAFKKVWIVSRFYKVIDSEIQKQKEIAAANDEENENYFEIPFITNFDGKTPMHLCMEEKNFKTADIMLQKLCNDPLDSHSRAINELLPTMIDAELPSLGNYLDSRWQQTDVLKTFHRAAIDLAEDQNYALTTAELWPDSKKIEEDIYLKGPDKIESDIKLDFLDVYSIHCYTEQISTEFFLALSNTEMSNLFSYKSIQALINFKWPLAKEYTIKVLFIPFCFYLAIFVAWSNAFNGFLYPFTYDTWFEMWVADKVLCALLYFFSVYFLSNELRQIYLNGPLAYLGQFWNYFDILPPCLIIAIVSIRLKIQYQDNYNFDEINLAVLTCFHAFASFAMWIKLLYFMRIFKSTGYLVKILTECLKDMKIFLFIYLTVVLAFNEGFMRLSEVSGDGAFNGQNYAEGYAFTFALSIGDTRTDNYDFSISPTVVWITFCLVLLVMNVVMLNLMVAIVSQSFDEINDHWEETMYQERASIIAENAYLIPWYRKEQHSGNKDRYLLVATEIKQSEEQDTAAAVEAVQSKINDVQNDLNSFKNEFREVHEEFAEKVNSQFTELIGLIKK